MLKRERALIGAAALLTLAAAEPPGAPSAAPQADEIVVTASPRKCRYRMLDRDLSDRELDQRAKIWALGTPVRIILPRGADRKCMIKVGMRLARQGVRVMAFVEPPEFR